MVRGTLAQKVLDAPMERDTGAQRAKGLMRMEGILCDMMAICDVFIPQERELASRSSSIFKRAEVAGLVRWYCGRELSVKTGSKVDEMMGKGRERKTNGRNHKSIPKHYQLSYDVSL